jgi:GNAT superfamily N-acetyltransferase
MTSLVTIRSFEGKDIGTVIDLLQDVSAYRPSVYEMPRLAASFSTSSNSYACVAIKGDLVVGFGTVFFLSRVRGGHSAIIEDVVVAPEVRGTGVGRRIIADLLAVAQLKECFKASLETASGAEQFYKKLGFESAGKVMKIILKGD